MADKPGVSVVIGSLNRLWYLKRAIASVRAELPFGEREIIVVDGGSDDGSIRWLGAQKDIITILQHNRGSWQGQDLPRRSWGYFMNLGFRSASAPYVCMLSDDCLVVPGAIRNGVKLFEAPGNERVGIVAFYWRNWPEQRRYHVGHTWGDRIFVNHGLYRRAALEEVGFVDEDVIAFYYGDGDLALRIHEAGWTAVDSQDSYVEHYSHANFGLRAGNMTREAADRAAYAERWGHLGRATQDWIMRDFDDPHRTVQRYWGRRVAASVKGRMLAQRLAGAARRLSAARS